LETVKVGIITPYKEQMFRIKAKISDIGMEDHVEVNTVDAFQGREKDIIIFSCVRSKNFSNEQRGIGFLSDVRRLNVALTRAKFGMYVIGNSEVLCSNAVWRRFLTHMNGAKNYQLCNKWSDFEGYMHQLEDGEKITGCEMRLPGNKHLGKRDKSEFEKKMEQCFAGGEDKKVISNFAVQSGDCEEKFSNGSPHESPRAGKKSITPKKKKYAQESSFVNDGFLGQSGAKIRKLLKVDSKDKLRSTSQSSASKNPSPHPNKPKFRAMPCSLSTNLTYDLEEGEMPYQIPHRGSPTKKKPLKTSNILTRIVPKSQLPAT
jgi:hypothetical protein